MFTQRDIYFMRLALDEAKTAEKQGEVPVGAVLVDKASERVLAVSGNRTLTCHDPTGHAEIEVLREAARLKKSPRLHDTCLYVTLEPCAMCAGAIAQARIQRLVFAALDPKGGAVLHGPRFFEQATCHWHPVCTHIPSLADEAGLLLTNFFQKRRRKKQTLKSKTV